MVKLQFIKSNNFNEQLICEANTIKLFIEAKVLREYFDIKYEKNLGDIIKQFYSYLGTFIPEYMKNNISKKEEKAMINSLSLSDKEEPNKIYCNHIMRNALGKKRSLFNQDKTKLLRPNLFEKFKEDKTISFCYSDKKEDERDDFYILKKFSENK